MQKVSRSQWGARPPRSRTTIRRSDGCSIHYPGSNPSAAVMRGDFSAVAAYLRNIQNFHMDTNYLTPGGGSDIAYSWFVCPLGRAWEGRAWGVSGGHTMGANSTCHGIQLIVTIDGAPTPAQIQTTRELIAEHDALFGKGWVKGHREVAGNPSGTACPGDTLLNLIHSGAFNPDAPPLDPPKDDYMAKSVLLENIDLRDEQFSIKDGKLYQRWADTPGGKLNVGPFHIPTPFAPDEVGGYVKDGRLHVWIVEHTFGQTRKRWQLEAGGSTAGWSDWSDR